MILKTHGRYHYSPIFDRPYYEWPGGKRLAFYIAINVEHFHFGEGLGHTPSYAPQILGRARARGDEIVAHGRTNSERQGDLDEAAERALIAEAFRIRPPAMKAMGRRVGWVRGFRKRGPPRTCLRRPAMPACSTGRWMTSRSGSQRVPVPCWPCRIRLRSMMHRPCPPDIIRPLTLPA